MTPREIVSYLRLWVEANEQAPFGWSIKQLNSEDLLTQLNHIENLIEGDSE